MRFFKRFLEICGTLFLRFFNIICSTVVMAMNIFVSFNHTWTLFKSGGLSGNLALAATIGCELAFIQSSINMIVAGLKRRKPGAPVIFVWLIGTGLVTWSNVSAGWGYGIVGILLGLVPPVLMLGSKSIFSWSVMGMDAEVAAQKQAGDAHITTHSHTVKEPHAVSDSHTHNDESHTVRDSHMRESHTVHSVREPHNEPHTVSYITEQSHTTTQSHEVSQAHTADSHDVREPYTVSHTAALENADTQPHTSHTKEESHTVRESHNEPHNVEPSHKESHTQKSHTTTRPHTVTQSHTEEDSHTDSHTESLTPHEWARRIYEQEGDFPSIRKLAEMAGCSEWQARKALQELKKRLA